MCSHKNCFTGYYCASLDTQLTWAEPHRKSMKYCQEKKEKKNTRPKNTDQLNVTRWRCESKPKYSFKPKSHEQKLTFIWQRCNPATGKNKVHTESVKNSQAEQQGTNSITLKKPRWRLTYTSEVIREWEHSWEKAKLNRIRLTRRVSKTRYKAQSKMTFKITQEVM